MLKPTTLQSSRYRSVLVMALAAMVATVIAIFLVDGRVAALIRPYVAGNAQVAGPFIRTVEMIFGFALSKFATGAFLLLCSIASLPFARHRWIARILLFAGVSHLATRLIAGMLKNVFHRLRPVEAFTGGAWHDRFFVDGGASFPSGHAAHFWALYFAAILAFPKLRIPALVLAVAVSGARISVNDHYVSDVLASAAIAAVVAVACAVALLPRQSRD